MLTLPRFCLETHIKNAKVIDVISNGGLMTIMFRQRQRPYSQQRTLKWIRFCTTDHHSYFLIIAWPFEV